MAKAELPSPEVLRQLLRYEPETGKLFWKERGAEWFEGGTYAASRMMATWNSNFKSKPAMDAIDETVGYRKGSILGRKQYAHRVIWVMMTGHWPSGQIDHINGDRTCNIWSNLRCVSKAVNSRNQRIRATNKSGMMGVSWNEKTGKWRAVITFEGLTRHIGVYPTFDLACQARTAAQTAFGFHRNHGV